MANNSTYSGPDSPAAPDATGSSPLVLRRAQAGDIPGILEIGKSTGTVSSTGGSVAQAMADDGRLVLVATLGGSLVGRRPSTPRSSPVGLAY